MNKLLCVMAVAVMSVIGWVNGIMTDIDLVRDYKAYQLESGEVIVAIITEPIFTSSKRQLLMQEIVDKLIETGNATEVYVSMDTDIYISISNITDDNSARIVINTIINRQFT